MGAGASQPKAPTKSVEPIKVSAGGATRQTKPVRPSTALRETSRQRLHVPWQDGGYRANAVLHSIRVRKAVVWLHPATRRATRAVTMSSGPPQPRNPFSLALGTTEPGLHWDSQLPSHPYRRDRVDPMVCSTQQATSRGMHRG